MNCSFVPLTPMSKKSTIWIATILMLRLFLPIVCTTAEADWEQYIAYSTCQMGISSTPTGPPILELICT